MFFWGKKSLFELCLTGGRKQCTIRKHRKNKEQSLFTAVMLEIRIWYLLKELHWRGRRDALQWACKSFMLSIKNLLSTYSFCLSLGVGWCYTLSLVPFTMSSFFCHCFLPHPFIPLLGLLSFPQNLPLLVVSLSLASQICVQFSWLCFLS